MFNKYFKINDNISVGENEPVFIIAEAGVSHFGSVEKAYKLVDLAVEAKASAIKFQIFDVDQMYTSNSIEWKSRLGPRQLNYQSFKDIKKYCDKKGIIFFATAHDEKSFLFLTQLDVDLFKVGSGEVKNWSYIRKIARTGKPVILSVGMYTFEDIKDVVNIFKEENNLNLIILHCVTNYPADPKEIALGNIKLIAKKFNVLTGYSDHTSGYHIPLASVAMGARVIEKHITLDYNIPNAQDWKVSCGPDNLFSFVRQVREIEETIKTRETGPTFNEIENSKWASKSLVLINSLMKGETIKLENLVAKRPGGGIPPSKIEKIVGLKVKKDIDADSLLTWDLLN